MSILGIDVSRANRPKKTGTESYGWHLIRLLQKYVPPETEVLLYTREPLEPDLVPLVSNWKERVLSWPPRLLWTLARLSWEMSNHPPNLLWIPTHTLPFFALKSVVTVHDVGFMARPELYNLPRRLYHLFSTARIIKNAAHIITVSEFSKKEIIRFCKVPADRVSVTALAADSRFHPQSAPEIKAVLAKYKIEAPYFIFVGRLEKKKNIDGLLAAFALFRAKHQNVKLVLAGRPGFGWEEARKLCSNGSVVELGWAESADTPALIAGALALVLPSHYEGFGLPVLEAFSCGTPVIASHSASLPEVGGEAALYIDPDKPEELVAAMGRIYKEPELRQKLSVLGSERAKMFSWEKTAETTWKILKRFL